MSKTACHPICPSLSPWCWVPTPGSEPGGAPGPAAPAATAVRYGGSWGPSAREPRCHGPFLARGSPAGHRQTPGGGGCSHGGRWDLPPASPPFPPSSCPPCPAPSGCKPPVEGQDRAPGLTVPCPCPPVAVPQVSSSPRRRRWPIGCGSLARWPKSRSAPLAPSVPPLFLLPAQDPRLLLAAVGHGQPHASALPLALQLLSTPFSGSGARGWWDVTLAGLVAPHGLH